MALEFVNTVDGKNGTDIEIECLRDYGDLVAWGVHVGVMSEEVGERLLEDALRRPVVAKDVYERGIEMRGHMRKIFDAVARGEDAPRDSLETLRRDECEALSCARLAKVGDKFVWEWRDEGEDPAKILYFVAHAAVELLTSDEINRVKHCAACHWLFMDRSKNRSRRWCTMEICGTNEKMRRYVERRKARKENQ